MVTDRIVNLYRKEYNEYIENSFSWSKLLHQKFLNGICYYHLDNFDKALKIFNSLLKKAKTDTDICGVLTFKALVHTFSGDITSAVFAYKQMLSINPALPDIWLRLSVLYNNTGELELFRQCNLECLKYRNDPIAYSNLGNYYFKTGEYDKALEYSFKAIEMDKGLHQAMGTIAMVYKIKGDMKNCQKYAELYTINGGDAEDIRGAIEQLNTADMSDLDDYDEPAEDNFRPSGYNKCI